MVPDDCQHNAHMYYLLLRDIDDRSNSIAEMKAKGIATVFHYVPLHDSPFSLSHSNDHNALATTRNCADRIVRLPLWVELGSLQDYAMEIILNTLAPGNSEAY